MAEQQVRAPQTRNSEAEPYATITFTINGPNGGTHREPCLVDSLIVGYKEDFQKRFGPVARQTWLYNGTEMENERNFRFYGIDGSESVEITVNVSDS